MVIAWLALGMACAALLLPDPAAATLPGGNGRLAFGILEENYGGSDEEEWFIAGYKLGLMTKDGRNRRLIARGLQSSFSPDGRLLAVAMEAPWGIVLLRLNGHPFRRLTYSPDHRPTWSPSGRRIAYTRQRCEQDEDLGRVCFERIYTIGTDGRDRRLLAEDATQPDWSSRNEIAYTGKDSSILVSDPAGTQLRSVAAGYSPSWAPGGERLAFVRRGGRAIATVSANGGPLRTIFQTKSGVSSPVWSPDGKRLAFVTGWGVTSLSLSGGKPVRLLPGSWCPLCDADSNSIEALAWQPLPRPSASRARHGSYRRPTTRGLPTGSDGVGRVSCPREFRRALPTWDCGTS
jgi:WD40 repeat protein